MNKTEWNDYADELEQKQREAEEASDESAAEFYDNKKRAAQATVSYALPDDD